jgi:hypothetical protein
MNVRFDNQDIAAIVVREIEFKLMRKRFIGSIEVKPQATPLLSDHLRVKYLGKDIDLSAGTLVIEGRTVSSVCWIFYINGFGSDKETKVSKKKFFVRRKMRAQNQPAQVIDMRADWSHKLGEYVPLVRSEE